MLGSYRHHSSYSLNLAYVISILFIVTSLFYLTDSLFFAVTFSFLTPPFDVSFASVYHLEILKMGKIKINDLSCVSHKRPEICYTNANISVARYIDISETHRSFTYWRDLPSGLVLFMLSAYVGVDITVVVFVVLPLSQ